MHMWVVGRSVGWCQQWKSVIETVFSSHLRNNAAVEHKGNCAYIVLLLLGHRVVNMPSSLCYAYIFKFFKASM